MKKRKTIEFVEKKETDLKLGLTSEEVTKRKEAFLTNKKAQKSGKSIGKIFFENTFTFFNLVWAVLFVLLVFVGSYKDLLFMVIIVANTSIAIFQEVKAKMAVEKLAFAVLTKVKTIRNGKETMVTSEELVRDDIFVLEVGNQIPADSIVVSGEASVNESMLTGESVPIKKIVGSKVYAGSFVTSGGFILRATTVGDDSYISSIEKQAKKFKSPSSNLFKDLNKIIKFIGVFIIPIGIVMYINNYYTLHGNFVEAISKTCGAVAGLIPAGMFLLVTIALAAAVVKLTKHKTLVQDIYSVEMLARTNVLCLDKTGTITDGTMKVSDVIEMEKSPFEQNFNSIIQNLLAIQSSNNNTSLALIDHFEKRITMENTYNIPFSSEKKFMAASFQGVGTIVLGAIEFICCQKNKELCEKAKELASEGNRVLIVAGSKDLIDDGAMPENLCAFAIIAVEDHIRHDAKDTISWFENNDVEIKIISGDNPLTVSNIAKRVGVKGWEKCVSLEEMSLEDVEKIADKYTIFGRVSPEQKYVIVKTLKKQGKVVAMTGDGVNDTLALKESDCSIAMAEGSEVTRSIANIVLMDSKFSSMPRVVAEGRQVINNVQTSSTLFLMKTLFAFAVSLFAIFTFSPYPFSTSQMVLIEFCVIGLPSLFLALQPSSKLVEGNFIPQVLKKSIPYASFMVIAIAGVLILGKFNILSTVEVETLSTLVLTAVGFINLVRICIPFSKNRAIAVILSALLIIIAIAIAPEFFNIKVFSKKIVLGFIFIVSFVVLLHLLFSIFQKINKKVKKINKNLI
ncbi:MAG: HAD-IC family P-type ATPase [Clostridia bacterium]